MNLLKILGGVAKVAAPAITAAVAGPEAGAVVGAASAAAFGVKKLDQRVQEKNGGGVRLRKVTAPAAAVGGAALATAIPGVGDAAAAQICAVLSELCASPVLLGAVIPAVVAIFGYGMGDNITKVLPAAPAAAPGDTTDPSS